MMDKNSLLIAIAILALILTAVFFNGYALFALLIFLPIVLWRISKKKDKTAKEDDKLLTIAEVLQQYGEPDESIVVDATRGNEAAGCILVYAGQRQLIVEGLPVRYDAIVDVSIVNTATPYTFGQYQEVLTTTMSNHQYLRLDAGLDAEWARNVAMEVIDAVRLPSSSAQRPS